jgi:class 3 adenylate cyclase
MANIRTTVILKTDIVDSTPRTAAQTQVEMVLQSKQHQRLISETAVPYHGSIFQEEGDAYWIEFPSVTSAALAAIQMHRNLRASQAGKQEKQRLAIRAVITVGDILYQESDSMGTTLSLTARIEKVTPPDEIYLSHAAWLILNKAEVQTSFVDDFHLKGFREPEKVYKVDQKHKTLILTDQFILFTDVRGFYSFVQSAGIEEVERFLFDCDDLLNDVCDRHGGIVRQVNGDQYFLTFTDADQTMLALEELCRAWRKMMEQYRLGISIGLHKGTLNVLRSFVYGDDIHTTTYLTHLEKFYFPDKPEIHAITSRQVRETYETTHWKGRFRELDPGGAVDESLKRVVLEHGAFEFLLDH